MVVSFVLVFLLLLVVVELAVLVAGVLLASADLQAPGGCAGQAAPKDSFGPFAFYLIPPC